MINDSKVVYRGDASSGVFVVTRNHQPFLPLRTRKRRERLGCNVNWGVRGPGQRALAVVLLLNATGNPQLTSRLYKQFAEEVLMRITYGMKWEMDQRVILAWLRDALAGLPIEDKICPEYEDLTGGDDPGGENV